MLTMMENNINIVFFFMNSENMVNKYLINLIATYW